MIAMSCLLDMNLNHVCKNYPQLHIGKIGGVMVARLAWNLS